MWIEAKNTFQGLNRYSCNPDDDSAFGTFFDSLQRNIDRIQNPLKNKPKSLNSRDRIRKSNEVTFPDGRVVTVDDTIRESAFLLSDGFDLDEFDALELILTGEIQARNFHQIPRGLCAIVCYYDARRYYCMLFKSLLSFYVDRLISNEASQKIRTLTTAILSKNENFYSLIDSYLDFSTAKEFQRLSNPGFNALGDSKHQATLLLIMEDIEMCCHEIICMFALYSQAEIQRDVLTKLFNLAYQFNPSHNCFTLQQLTVWTSLLLFINPFRLRTICDGSTDVYQYYKQLLDADKWEHRCVKATFSLCFGVSVKYARSSLSLNVPPDYDAREMVDDGIENLALEFINAFILKVPKFSTYTFLVDVLDSVVKNFICYFREKVHEMFCLCEDELHSLAEETKVVTERTASNMHFKSLVELITTLYEPDTPQLKNYAEQFTDHKFEALREFVCGGRQVTAPALSISYLAMIKALCKSQNSGNFIFNLFR